MLRITNTRSGKTTRIQLEGKLVGPWVEECRALFDGETALGQKLALDVTEVRYADQEGMKLLRHVAEAGHVEKSSGYAAELMRKSSKGETMDGANTDASARVAGKVPLVARLRAGQAGAHEELLQRHGGAMLATAQRFLPHGGEALDALKDAFQAACRGAHECAADAKLPTWLHRLVVDVCVTRLSSAPEPGSELHELLPGFDPSGSHAQPVAPWTAREETPAELHAEVRQKIDELPPAYRVVVLLADHEGLRADEIARRLGLARAEVEERLHRARQALITLLAPALSPREAG